MGVTIKELTSVRGAERAGLSELLVAVVQDGEAGRIPQLGKGY